MRIDNAAAWLDTHGHPARVNPNRLAFVTKLYCYLDDMLVTGITGERVETALSMIRRFMVFVDRQKSNSLELAALEKHLLAYDRMMIGKVKTSQTSQNTAGSNVITVARFVAYMLGEGWNSFRLRNNLISQSRYNPPADNQHQQIQGFCSDLGDIIDGVSVEALKALESPMVRFRKRDEHEEYVWRLSPHGVSAETPYPFRHLRAIKTRVLAEMKRFVAVTGMNPHTVEKLRVDDLIFDSGSNRYRAVGFKGRAKANVEVDIPRSYVAALRQHISFLKAIDFENKRDLLFPVIGGVFQGGRYCTAFRYSESFNQKSLRKLFSRAGRPFFNGRDLRRNKGVYVLRRKDGDSLKAAAVLGNAPATAAKYYGGQGNRAENEVEMTRYFQGLMEASESRLARAPDPGLCQSPNRPVAVPDAPQAFKPKCGAENACLFCQQYRAIDTTDYLHALLTRREEILRRDGGLQHPQTYETLKRIGRFVQVYRTLSDQHEEEAERIAKEVEKGRLHPFFQNAVEMSDIGYAGALPLKDRV